MAFPNALSALKHRNFRIYWTGQAISLVGTWMQMMAQGWVMTDLSSDAFMLGLLNASGSLPILLLSLKGGELADRLDKRRILIVTQLAMMFLAFVFAALVFSGKLAMRHVFIMAVLLGITTAFDLPAAQSLPPELVDRAEIPVAVGLMQSIFHGSRLIGPALAGILIARFGRGSAFLANGLSFAAVIASLLLIRQRPRESRPKRPSGSPSMIGEGFAYVRAEPVIRALISLSALSTGLVFPFLAVLMVYYVRYALGTNDAQVMGFVMSSSGVGSLLGAAGILWGAPASRRFWLLGAIVGIATGLLGLSLVRSLGLVLALTSVLAFSVASLMGRVSQMVQERVPGELRGRVMGIFSISFTGIMPFTTMGWSWLIDRLGHGTGYPRVMQISAGLFVVSALSVMRHTWRALADAPATRRTPPLGAP